MTLITFQGGRPVLRNGKVGAGQGCCCCYGCVRDGEVVCQYTTKEECEDCVRTYQCYERVNTECDGDCPDGYDPYTEVRTTVTITFSSACWASAYSAEVYGLVIGCGQILSAAVTFQSGTLAKFGHVAPTVTAAPLDESWCVQGGAGAVLGVTLEEVADPYGCGFSVWRVASVEVINGGSGYVSDPNDGCVAIAFTAGVSREPPTLAATATGGSGASLTVAITENAGSPQTWRVSGITVGSGGSGYTDGASVTITAASGDTTQAAATATIQTNRVAPTVSVAEYTVAGSGAVVTVTLTETQNWQGSGRSVWRVTAFTVVDGGSGYVEGDSFEATVTDGVVMPGEDAICLVSSVDESGAVLAVELWDQGVYYKSTDVIAAVVVGNAGQYYGADPEPNPITLQGAAAQIAEVDEDGAILSITVTDGGAYYREDATAAPYVATPTITFNGGYGSGAVIIPTIDTDTSSPTFGKITSLDVTEGGSGYFAQCARARSVSSCADCPPRDSPEYSQCNQVSAEGPCGTWQQVNCEDVNPPCCESCLPECVPTLNASEGDGVQFGYSKSSTVVSQPNRAFWGDEEYSEGWLAAHAGCTLVWVQDSVSQSNETGTFCGLHHVTGQPAYSRRTWVRFRLFLIDCRTGSLRDVTDEALAVPYGGTVCTVPAGPFGQPLCDPLTACSGDSPGFLNDNPTLVCP
jgi:hypothetical protein